MATDQENLLYESTYEDQTPRFCGCGYFSKFCVTRWWRRGNNLEEDEKWVFKKLKGLKEFSEKIAGPKWKNFIRSFSCKKGKKKVKRDVDFSYDIRSYSLNFDDGGDKEPSPERFVAVPVVIKV